MENLVDIHSVEVLRRGTYHGVDFNDEVIASLVEKYDANVEEAQINLGHSDDDDAVYGAVSALRYEAPALLADLTRVPEDLAEKMLYGGARPGRSIEVSLDIVELQRSPWIKRVPREFIGLGLLGTKKPAVGGMKRIQHEQIIPRDNHLQVMGFADDGDWLRLSSEQETIKLHDETIIKEIPAMAKEGKDEQDTVLLSDHEALKLQLDALEKEKAEGAAALAEANAKVAMAEQKEVELSATVEKHTETIDKLALDAALTKQRERVHLAESFMAQLRTEKGGTVAPLSDTSVVALMAKLDSLDETHVIKLADDTDVHLGEALRAVLSALPAFDGHIEIAPLKDDKGNEVPQLTEQQAHLAEQAGLDPETYAKELAKMDKEGN